MCIIVAKPAGAKMPDKKIIENCFYNNPDGAGIMLNHNGKVYGFKGFMSLEAFNAKLAQLEKKYGKLTGKNVVMHFRIGTHGANIAANTHPFPVVSSYKSMRELEWVSGLGMAHNGIIDCVSRHIDVKKENVSDTMVFIKRVVNPIASKANLIKSDKLLEAIWLASDSKLAFMDGQGGLKVLGDFVYQDGIYYSNTSYSHIKQQYSYKYYGGWNDYDWGKTYAKSAKSKTHKVEEVIHLSKDDENFLRESLADDYGFEQLWPECEIVYEGGIREKIGNLMLAYDPSSGCIYEWDTESLEWYVFMYESEFDYISIGDDVIE